MTKRYRKNSKGSLLVAYNFAGYNATYAARSLKRGVLDATIYRGFWMPAFLILLAFLVSLGWYVLAVSARVGEDYRQQKLERQIEHLTEEHNNLIVRLSQEKTLDKIEERALTLGLIPAVGASYVALPGSSVALNKEQIMQ